MSERLKSEFWGFIMLNCSAVVRAIPAFLLLVLLSNGCSDDRPQRAEAALRQQIQNESGGKIRLKTFTKVDGQTAGDTYIVYYEAQIEFLASGRWYTGGIPDRLIYKFTPDLNETAQRSPEKKLFDDENHIVPALPFFLIKISGTLTGVKMDSGWRFEPTVANIAESQKTP